MAREKPLVDLFRNGEIKMIDDMSRVFILVDDQNRIVRLEGEYTLPQDLSNWIQIDKGYGDTYSLAQTHYLEKPLMTDEGIYRYKYVQTIDAESGQAIMVIVERLESEIQAEIDAIPILPTDDERRDAQILYTALMTDTLLED